MRSNKELFLPMIIVPIMFSVVMPLILGLSMPFESLAPSDIAMLRLALQVGPEIPDSGLLIIYMTNNMLKPFMFLMPSMTASIIAADAIAGEKERKTIESLLVLPLTDREIIVGKVVAAMLPSFLSTWLSFATLGLTINLAGGSNLGGYVVVFGDLSWWIMPALLLPLVAYLYTLLMVLVSVKAKNVKSAQNYSALAVIPLFALLATQFLQVFVLDVLGTLVLAGLVGAIALLLTFITTKRLNRERLILALD